MRTFLVFLWLVMSHWLALAGGAVAITLVALYERYYAVNVPGVVYTGLLLAFVVWASYLAWLDERKGVDALSKRFKPDIKGRVIHIQTSVRPDSIVAAVMVSLRNEGSDSIADRFEVQHEGIDGAISSGVLIKLPGDVTLSGGSVFAAQDDLNEKTINAPIIRGAQVTGVLYVQFKDRPMPELSVGRYLVSFSDVHDARHTFASGKLEQRQFQQPTHFPGFTSKAAPHNALGQTQSLERRRRKKKR